MESNIFDFLTGFFEMLCNWGQKIWDFITYQVTWKGVNYEVWQLLPVVGAIIILYKIIRDIIL